MSVTAGRLDTRERRTKLAMRDKPYFFDLRRGMSIGYRKGTDGSSWVLREFRNGKYFQRRLGGTDDDVPADGVHVLSWNDVRQMAATPERPTGARAGRHTVTDAWIAYSETRKSPIDVTRETPTWTSFISPTLRDREVSELTVYEIEKWLVAKVKLRGRRGYQIAEGKRIVAVRVHLDACPAVSGALRVVPGSHTLGRLKHAEAEKARTERGETLVPVLRGGALLMRPLVLQLRRRRLFRSYGAHYTSCSLDTTFRAGCSGGTASEWHDPILHQYCGLELRRPKSSARVARWQ